MAVEIEIKDLRLVLNRILDHIEFDLDCKTVGLDQDDYWEVADADRYDLTKSPDNYSASKLSDDWEFLASIIADKDQAVSLMLVHAAPLLRRLGEQIGR